MLRFFKLPSKLQKKASNSLAQAILEMEQSLSEAIQMSRNPIRMLKSL